MSESPAAPTSAEATRGYSADKARVTKRLRRIEGQVRGIERMIDEDRYCIDVLTQISAVQAALGKVSAELMHDHVQHCVIGADSPDERAARADELMLVVNRMIQSR